jgi:hypothetical protein
MENPDYFMFRRTTVEQIESDSIAQNKAKCVPGPCSGMKYAAALEAKHIVRS